MLIFVSCQRGETPIEDAANIKELLNSAKEESELTMCTDVDRNDKVRRIFACRIFRAEIVCENRGLARQG